MKNLTIKNVVAFEKFVGKTYPFWSDYGCLTNFAKVTTVEDGEYKSEIYQTEDIRELPDGYRLTIEYAGAAEIVLYQDALKAERIRESHEYSNSVNAKVGDTIEVIRGRKYSVGLRAVIKSESEFYDQYGRLKAVYWVCETGERINKHNAVVVA